MLRIGAILSRFAETPSGAIRKLRGNTSESKNSCFLMLVDKYAIDVGIQSTQRKLLRCWNTSQSYVHALVTSMLSCSFLYHEVYSHQGLVFTTLISNARVVSLNFGLCRDCISYYGSIVSKHLLEFWGGGVSHANTRACRNM